MSKTPGSRFAAAVARKGVLRVDGYPTRRDLRSKIMRRVVRKSPRRKIELHFILQHEGTI
jgi:hypothetical protein